MTTIEARKAALLARERALKARIGGIAEELVSHEARDWEEMAVEREGDEVLEGMGTEAKAELRAIWAALGRIGAGQYGICQRRAAEIPAARLDALPYTPFCKACAT